MHKDLNEKVITGFPDSSVDNIIPGKQKLDHP